MLILTVLLMCSPAISAQRPLAYKVGITGENNLHNAIHITPYSGAMGFDNRYEGVKGTPRLFDTLLASSVLLKGEELFFRIESDLDVVKNALVYLSPSKGMLMEVPSEHISEVIIHKDGNDLIFLTSEGLAFDQEIEGNKFCQLLNEGTYQCIKIPDRKLIEADYQRLYSPDVRYDELQPVSRYYIRGNDSVFHRVQLNRKSLKKVFPDKKEIIESNFNEKTVSDPEAAVIELLGKF